MDWTAPEGEEGSEKGSGEVLGGQEEGREGESGEKLDNSARAAPGDRGKPVGTELRKDLMMSWSAWVRVR